MFPFGAEEDALPAKQQSTVEASDSGTELEI